MKGLLIKDFCMLMKHCRMHFIVILFFLLGAIFSGELFFLFYPCVLAGMFPTTLLAYDEASKWMQYSATLPYKRSQIVGVKYLIGAFLICITLILTTIANTIFQIRNGGIDFSLLSITLSTTMLLGFAMPAISLPFMFKLGVQKGRTAYFITIGVVFGSLILFTLLFKQSMLSVAFMQAHNEVLLFTEFAIFPLSLIIVSGLYAVSYLIATKLFQNKEL